MWHSEARPSAVPTRQDAHPAIVRRLELEHWLNLRPVFLFVSAQNRSSGTEVLHPLEVFSDSTKTFME